VPLLHRLVERMNEHPELDAVGIVAPEAAFVDDAEQWEEALLEDPLITARLRAIGFHRYGGYIEDRDRSDATVPWWLTEFNAAAGFCYEPSWEVALDLAGNLLSALESGVKAGLVWTDYDAPHSHSDDDWETFGLLQTSYDGLPYLCDAFPEPPSPSELDRMTYAPKPSYYAAKHAFRHVRPGALRRPLGPGAEGSMVAFDNLDGSTAVFGINFEGADELELELGPGAPSSLRLYVSTAESQHEEAGTVTLQDGAGTVSIPAESVFTLVGGPD
jgi:O-glycosyl hydrolase